MSLSLTFSSISSDSDYEDDYPIRKSYKDEPFYYDGISDEELHSHLNREFEERVNWIKYGVCFSSFMTMVVIILFTSHITGVI